MQNQPSNTPASQPQPKKVDLATLYPAVKTYDQQEQHRFQTIETKAVKKDNELRFSSLYISIALSAVVFFGLYILTFIPIIISHSATAGVPISLLFILALYGLALILFKQIASQVEMVGLKASLLFGFYIAAFAPHLFAWRVFSLSAVFNPQLDFGLTIYHFVLLLLLMSILFTKLLKQNIKLILMSFVTIISLFVAVIVYQAGSDIPVPVSPVQEQGF